MIAPLGRCISACIAALLFSACGEKIPTAPEPLPSGAADGLAFDNMALIRRLERQERSQTILTAVSAFSAGLDGRVNQGSAWTYVYTDVAVERLYYWRVYSDGHIEPPEGPVPPPRPGVIIVDIDSMLRTNSDGAVSIALKNGADQFVGRYNGVFVTVTYEIVRDLPVCHLTFRVLREICAPEYWVHATNGDFMAKEDFCLGPGLETGRGP